jgi:bis(5'-nucleosyl)-tetraphosphatase (symmetrical)
MATDNVIYVIGDVQGCFYSFLKLLANLPTDDEVWLCGDIINRGPDSLKMLRWVYRNQDKCKLVLGNHDIHAIAVLAGLRKEGKLDTLHDLVAAPDRYTLIDFLRTQPFLHTKNKVSMVHAGLLHLWDFDTAQSLARDLHMGLQGENWQNFLSSVFSNEPDTWHPDLLHHEKMCFAMNVFTRMRYINQYGQLNFQEKKYPPNHMLDISFRPWFEWYNQKGMQNLKKRKSNVQTVVSGHWSDVALVNQTYTVLLDTGCVWRRQLTAVAIDSKKPDSREFFQQIYVG